MRNDQDAYRQVLAEIQHLHGLDLTPDENGLVTIGFANEVSCTLELPPASQHIYFHALIERVPLTGREALFAKLLRLNAFDLPLPCAWLSVDQQTDGILLCGALPLPSLTVDSLSDTLVTIADHVPELRRTVFEGRDQASDAPNHVPDASKSIDLHTYLRG